MAARPTPVHFHNAADGLATTVELNLWVCLLRPRARTRG